MIAHRRILVANSWCGSVHCALELFLRKDIFCVMNVKTGCEGFPKKQLLKAVREIKGNSQAQRHRRVALRGQHIAYVKTFQVGNRKVIVRASGHNERVSLLLVLTAYSLLPGQAVDYCERSR